MAVYLYSPSYAAANAASFTLLYGPAGHGSGVIGQDVGRTTSNIPPYVNLTAASTSVGGAIPDGTVMLLYDITHLVNNTTVIPTTDFTVNRVTSAGASVDISANLGIINSLPRMV
jgi:hypothetical protein